MKILADETIPRVTVATLRGLGHDVRDVRGTSDEGAPDSELWRTALDERRMLLTTDRGFTEYRRSDHSGILIVRLRQPNRLKIHRAVLVAMERFSESEWAGLLVVVRDTTLSVSKMGGAIERL